MLQHTCRILFAAMLNFIALSPTNAVAQHAGHNAAPSPYAGQESRDIKSLSPEDVAELQRGGGWGLAKAAELNGFPGPAHILELKQRLGLSSEQIAAVENIFAKMHEGAITEGTRLIALERALESTFRARDVTETALKTALAEIESSRQALRYIHLAAHLSTPAILDQRQMRLYAAARSYKENPCSEVPDGHDPALWRRHNGCQ